MLYAKITRDLKDTGERRYFERPPKAPGEIADHKPYWVPVTVDPAPALPGRGYRFSAPKTEITANGVRQYRELEPVTVTPQMVKREAHRRIVAVVPEWKQRNLTAQATLLAEKGRSAWTADELRDWNAGFAIWSQVAAIRAASDAIEAMNPIPVDFDDDRRWP